MKIKQLLKTFSSNYPKGFTLVEMLVVVLIIGILAAIAVPQYQKAVAKSKVMSMKPLLRSITEAENAYKLRTGQYTTNLNLLDISMPPATSIDESGALVYSDFSCNTQEYSDNYSIFCTPNKEGFPFLEKYFDQATFHCWANKTALGEKVCQELSGKTTSSYDHQDYGHLYQFY